MEGNALITVEKLCIEKRKTGAAARRRQRLKQKLNSPEKYELAKLKNRLSTAKYARNKRLHSLNVSAAEVIADKRLKALSRWKQRQRKRIEYFWLPVVNKEGKRTVVNEKCRSV